MLGSEWVTLWQAQTSCVQPPVDQTNEESTVVQKDEMDSLSATKQTHVRDNNTNRNNSNNKLKF